ncbi:amino-acid N-acetyltransferase [Telmatocola sphagniphila]|uniref:amino-acid N-acetyltransferase n=1 Tax=Telmatocola sphagniphila TaxID=1123043 RepID=A0A8E6B484_9BACT|nr:amino-acid N-acetyltransferase [Telmatocola sphagniphila]QVL31426.1 amino-acid N-acetyltransferase [Telmatocola sphagniphila]
MLQLTALREILRYIPQFRDRVFVIAIDGAIVDDENFGNLLLDVALMRSLRIGVVIVHGAGAQVRLLAEKEKTAITNHDGIGITDLPTLEISIRAANRVTHEILVGLSAVDLLGACGNPLVAHPAGILGGVDHLYTGKIERMDVAMLRNMLEHNIIPVIPPLGSDGQGRTYRLNSDAVAVDVAKALQAVKLIYLSEHSAPKIGTRLLRSLTMEEAGVIVKKQRTEIVPNDAISKLENAVRAAKDGVPRVHIIDGRMQEGLLGEVFSNEGVGTLIHANEYQSIRKALKKDIRTIMSLIQLGVDADELLKRSRAEVERLIDDFFVFEVDGNAVACGAVHLFPEDKKAELACVYVQQRYENQGIGAKLIRYGEELAKIRGAEELLTLSTQAINYFIQKGGFRLATPEDLPGFRKERYERSGRKSQVLIKRIAGEMAAAK